MKKLITFISIVLVTLSSCQITEKIYINDDGSGSYELEINMNEMMKSLNEMGGQKPDSTAVAKDSIINFSDLLKGKEDSISKLSREDKKLVEVMKNMQMKIHEDKAKSEMVMSYIINFKNVEELQDAQNAISKASAMGDDKTSGLPVKTDMIYRFKKNKFIRTTVPKELSEEQLSDYDSEMEKMNMFLEGSFYNLEYHFPRAVKNISSKDATLSDDKKTVYLKLEMKDAIDNPDKLNLEVTLEKR